MKNNRDKIRYMVIGDNRIHCERLQMKKKLLKHINIKNRLVGFSIIFILFVLLIDTCSFAATKTWTGSISTDWTVGANWGGTAPASGDIILIPTVASGIYPVISTNVTTGAITINSNSGIGASLTIQTSGALTSGLIKINANGTFNVLGGAATLKGITSSGSINIQGGMITSAADIIISSGTLTQSGGTFWMAANTSTNPTDNLVITGGNVTQSGGTFSTKDYSPTNGTFYQTGSGSIFRIFHDWKPSSTHIFNSTSGTVQFSGASGAGPTFVNNQTQFNNILIDAGFNPGFDNTSNSIVNISGNFTNNNVSLINSVKVTFNFNGTGTQTITSGSSKLFTNLTINKSSGTLILASGIIVLGTLNMTSGNIFTDVNVLTLGTSTAILGTLTYTSGQIIGSFKRWIGTAAGNNTKFPVGTTSNYNGVVINYTSIPSAGGTLTARFIASDPGTHTPYLINDAGYIIDVYGKQGYWKIDAADGLLNGTYNINLDVNGFVGVTDITKIRILKRTNSTFDWSVTGSTHTPGSGLTAKRSNMRGFSEFALGGNSNDNPLESALPVEISLFTSNVTNRDVNLNWTTTIELNNAGFEILRSTTNDYENWTKIGYVKGNGSKNTPTYYSFGDKNLQSGKYKYRLKQIDYNGNYQYYNLNNTVEVGLPLKYNLSQNYPNPFNPVTRINFEIPEDSKVNISVFDLTGRVIKTIVNEFKTAGYYTIQFNASGISSGAYFYRIITEGDKKFEMTKKLVVLK